jgi:hypothetical protein
MAMPLCDRSLHDRLRQCEAQGMPGVPPGELMGYVTEVARALDFLNETHHVQHRDVKPRNLFLMGGSAVVADFGLAKILAQTAASHSGAMTPHYAPPEFFRDQVTSASDQYSLAAAYCELRCGQLPFTGTLHGVIHRILHEEPDLGKLPPEERPAVSRALSKRPEQRWPNCRAFVEALPGGGGGRSRSRSLRALASEVRVKTLRLLGEAKVRELTWAPAGTANHLLWHAGHALWVQDALCVQILTGKSELPPGWAEAFRMGSRPASWGGPWPTRDELARQLEAQLPRLLALLGPVLDADLDVLPPFAHRGDPRTLEQCVIHGLHDEANHQGEMYLLLKEQRLGPK